MPLWLGGRFRPSSLQSLLGARHIPFPFGPCHFSRGIFFSASIPTTPSSSCANQHGRHTDRARYLPGHHEAATEHIGRQVSATKNPYFHPIKGSAACSRHVESKWVLPGGVTHS